MLTVMVGREGCGWIPRLMCWASLDLGRAVVEGPERLVLLYLPVAKHTMVMV